MTTLEASYTQLIQDIDSQEIESSNSQEVNTSDKTIIQHDTQPQLFTVDQFIKDVRTQSIKNNKNIYDESQYMNAYDIASNCIREIVLKLLKYPIKDYSHAWLPILLRSAIGKAVHSFIQDNSTVFTEQECSLKVPSINVSGRVDCLINDSVLVEIKSCTYDDYHKILTTQRPRIADFYQTILYKYLLENHLPEIQNQPRDNLRSDPPKLSKYNIRTVQFIYVAHNIFSQSVTDINSALKYVTEIKKLLRSRYNKFHFITVLNINLDDIDLTDYIDYIKTKIRRVNYYLEGNKIPPLTDDFVDPKKCYFCMYKSNCKSFGE